VTADGDVLGTVFVTRDVTELTDAIRAREDFLAGVSHELRTPLTSIIGYLEIVQESDDTDPYGDVRPQLDIVQRNAGQLMMRIGDLLHVADEKVPLRVRTVDVPTLVRHAIDSIRVRAANAGVTVNGRCGEPFDAVLDPGRFAQLLDNLVTNAVKYTPAGGQVLVTVGHDERELVLTVRDDGRGIPAGELDRIFERFYRAESVRSSAIGGAGLGLSIVKQIVNAHGGTVSAESQPEAGSTFTVRLPLRPAE
jgi:signal transduction histidine kinase